MAEWTPELPMVAGLLGEFSLSLALRAFLV
jgi:hypothetical protein